MRKLLFLFIGLMFATNGFCQTYHPIPLDSVYWVELHQGPYMGGGGVCIQSNYDYIYPAGQVTINSLLYTEFRSRTLIEYDHLGPPPSTCPPNSNLVPDYSYAFIRNDSINKKVWMYDSINTHSDILLYDFDISMGDTIDLLNGYNSICSDTFTIGNIDSVNIGGAYRQRYKIMTSGMGWGTIYMIEGVGSNYGLAFNLYCPFEYTSHLICYHYKQFGYAQVNSDYCTTTLKIENEVINALSIVRPIGPDQFEIINPENHKIAIECYDISGKFILKRSFYESGTIDFSNNSTGIYLMYITVDGQMAKPYKFIITH
jgi:hypothetical protein